MESALQQIGFHPPDVVLVDIGLPGMSGIEGVRVLRQRFPSVACVMFTVYKDDDRIFQAMCAGACGYLLKKTAPARLVESLREIAEGGAVMSPEVAVRVIELFRKNQPSQPGSVPLSPQEARLLKLLTEAIRTKPPQISSVSASILSAFTSAQFTRSLMCTRVRKLWRVPCATV